MKGFNSIRQRLLTWVLAVAGLILVAVIVWSYSASRHRLEGEMEAKAGFLADSAARQIDAQLGVLQGVVHGMALALESQHLAMPFEQVRALQTECLEKNPGIYGVCVALEPETAPSGWPDLAPWGYREGKALVYEGLSGSTCGHLREDWFGLPKHLGRPVWSEPYEWKGVLMVTYSVPVYSGDAPKRRFAGVVTCDLTLDWLDRMIAALPLGKGGYGLLISRNATYVAHPLRELVLNETVYSIAEARNDPALRKTGQQMVSGKPGVIPFKSFVTEDLSWLAYTPLRSGDWIMAAIISRDEMNAAIIQLSRNQMAIGLLGLLLLALAIGRIARSITRPLAKLSEAANTLAGGNLDAPLPEPPGRDEVAHLTHAFAEMRDNLRRYVSDLRETTAARERMSSELRIAHDIQMGLVPKTFPAFPSRNDLDLYGVLEPAREVGGDFYDFFLLDDNRIALAIGDVSGKGVPAALFMAVTRSFLRSAFKAETDPAAVMANVNGELVEGNDTCMFVTLFCAVLDLTTGRLRYANAGHNPPAIRHPDGSAEWIARPRGPIAGVVPKAVYEDGTLVLSADDTLILYTDGVTEAMNAAEELYGEKRMSDSLAAPACGGDCRTTTERMLADIRAFTQGAEQSDDITLLVIKSRTASALPPPDCAAGHHEFSVENNFADMERVLDDVGALLDARQFSAKRNYSVRLALDELLSNVIKYAYDDASSHRIALNLELDIPFALTIADDGKPFNPLEDAPPPVLDGPVEDRPIGGLGLHILQKMGMKLAYRRENNRNVLRVVIPEDEH
ncbi:MAG: SpoIIE family protein phosphatase [Kiritimatiellae bacterium]|nr:SpoIIE family protein phosphatase [Kiritimatiellia bacterium]